MTNIQVGLKLYRNVEAMSMAQISDVVKHINGEMDRIGKVSVTAGNGGRLQNQLAQLKKNLPLLQRLAKKKLDEHLAKKPMQVEAGDKPPE